MVSLYLSAIILFASNCSTIAPTSFAGSSNQSEPLNIIVREDSADDLVATPDGYAYRANCYQVDSVDNSGGESRAWLKGVPVIMNPIEDTTVTIGCLNDTAQITYRDIIGTHSNKTRNNIFSLYLSEAAIDTVSITWASLPSGINVVHYSESYWYFLSAHRYQSIYKIEIGPDVKPGQYTINFEITINGKKYGSIPCVIAVKQE